ncbi:RNA-directed DNA polymerase from mobile element jockey [Trichonephila clavipes]|nr:RNA-directed DNA polymerase from mobile element jockey [Trichonephila clavipes]
MLRQYLSCSNSERLTQPALARSPLFHLPETSTVPSKVNLRAFTTNLLPLDSLDVPLFSIPPNQAALDKTVARVTSKQKKAAAPTENNISDNTNTFGTRVAFEPYDGYRNRQPNQCWRCQEFFHSSVICHLSMKCLKCAGPQQAKDCTLHFEDPLKCANYGGENAANWRQCPRFLKSKKAPNHQNKEQNPDLLLVQDKKLQPGLDPLIANYLLHKDDRNNFPRTRTYGGIAIYCKTNYVHNRVLLPTLQYMDATAIEIKLNNFPSILIVSVYARNTQENNRKFPDKDFLKILNSGLNIITAGDLYATHPTWSNARSKEFGYVLRKIVRIEVKSNVRIVAPHTPTHINASSRTGARDHIIDLAVLKNIPFNHDIKVLNDFESDHLPGGHSYSTLVCKN